MTLMNQRKRGIVRRETKDERMRDERREMKDEGREAREWREGCRGNVILNAKHEESRDVYYRILRLQSSLRTTQNKRLRTYSDVIILEFSPVSRWFLEFDAMHPAYSNLWRTRDVPSPDRIRAGYHRDSRNRDRQYTHSLAPS